jgi:hypothetical protein
MTQELESCLRHLLLVPRKQEAVVERCFRFLQTLFQACQKVQQDRSDDTGSGDMHPVTSELA